MIADDDALPKKKPAHVIGQDLALLSREELAARIALLQDEIARLEAAVDSKEASRRTADQFFKRSSNVELGPRPHVADRINVSFSLFVHSARGRIFIGRINIWLSFLVYYGCCPESGRRVAPVHSV